MGPTPLMAQRTTDLGVVVVARTHRPKYVGVVSDQMRGMHLVSTLLPESAIERVDFTRIRKTPKR